MLLLFYCNCGTSGIIFWREGGVLRLTRLQSNVYSATITVVVLLIILGVNIHRAFLSDTLQKPTKQE